MNRVVRKACATAAAAVCAVLAIPVSSPAHELGTTQAAAIVDRANGTYLIDVIVDPDALLPLLEIRDGRQLSAPVHRDARDRAIAALGPVFLDAVHVAFDGRPTTPRFEYRPSSAFADFAQAPSTVRLAGQIPEGARQFTFAYAL